MAEIWYSPTGSEITGTLERVEGKARGTFKLDKEWEYGDGTDLFWEDQETFAVEGSDVFLDDDNVEWFYHHLIQFDDGDEIERFVNNDILKLIEKEKRIGFMLRTLRRASYSNLDDKHHFFKEHLDATIELMSQEYQELKAKVISELEACKATAVKA